MSNVPLNDMQPRLCFDDLRDLTRFETKGSLLKLGLHVSFPEKSSEPLSACPTGVTALTSACRTA